MNIAKSPIKCSQIEFNITLKRSFIVTKWALLRQCRGWFHKDKSIKVIHHTDGINDRNHIVILIRINPLTKANEHFSVINVIKRLKMVKSIIQYNKGHV